MKRVRGIFCSEKWASKILFSLVVAILVGLIASWSAMGYLLENVNNFNSTGTGYNLGYSEAGYRTYGYHTYGYQPIKDQFGLRPNGSLVKLATGPEVYWIDEGTRRHVMSPVAFWSWGFKWDSVVTITAAELLGYDPANTAANNNLLMRPGTLVKSTDSAAVYIFGFDEMLHWITTPEVFHALQLKWADVQVISAGELALYTAGTNISTSSIPADGSLLKGDAAANIYLWEDVGATYAVEWIRTPVAFWSWGFNGSSVITIDQLAMNALVTANPGGDIKAKPGTLLKGAVMPNIFVVDNLAIQETAQPWPSTTASATYHYKKRWIPSPTVFHAKGYRVEDVMIESLDELLSYANGTAVQ